MNFSSACMVGNDDAQQIIGISRHQVAFHDFGKRINRRLKHFQRGFDLLLQADLDEHADVQPEFRGIEPASHSDGSTPDCSRARTRARQGEGDRPTARGEFDIGQPGVVLQFPDDALIYRIKVHIQHFMLHRRIFSI